MARRNTRIAPLLLLAWVAAGCSAPTGPPDFTVVGGGLTIRFADQDWDAYGSGDMVISQADLVPIGRAQRADPSDFAGTIVYRIAGFDPTKVLAMIDRSVPTAPEIVVIAPVGHSPANDPDLCRRLYRPEASICPVLPSQTR